MIYDLAIIGAGSGGLSVTAAVAQFGQKVILFEKGKMGGDCRKTGPRVPDGWQIRNFGT
jgi:pyruvate/2-oxoglutarate dehydrogenase complex dihydrolipoamide dehydrogenase (E3) component